MQEHSIIGERILKNVDDYSGIARIVRHHHERVDGHRLPRRATVGTRSRFSRESLQFADAYNAMTSHRPYRDAMPAKMTRIRRASSGQKRSSIPPWLRLSKRSSPAPIERYLSATERLHALGRPHAEACT